MWLLVTNRDPGVHLYFKLVLMVTMATLHVATWSDDGKLSRLQLISSFVLTDRSQTWYLRVTKATTTILTSSEDGFKPSRSSPALWSCVSVCSSEQSRSSAEGWLTCCAFYFGPNCDVCAAYMIILLCRTMQLITGGGRSWESRPVSADEASIFRLLQQL